MPRLPHPRTALSGYADSRLPAWRRAVVRHHLLGCTRCAVEVGQIRALGEVLRSSSPSLGEAPDELVDRLLAIGRPAPADPGEPAPADPVEATGPADPPVPADVVERALPPVPVQAAGTFVPVRPVRTPGADDGPSRASVGAAGVLVAAVVMVGTVGAGAAVTGVPVPWPSATARASMSTVLLPRLWADDAEPGGAEPGPAVSVRPVDNGSRP